MDLQLTGYDLDITNGLLSFVTGRDAIRQHLEMRLRTFLEEYVYDRSAGVPWVQVVFKRNTSLASVDAILRQVITATPGVEEVIELSLDVNRSTRVLTGTGRVRSSEGVLDFNLDPLGVQNAG